jgi:hypothetical protein
MEKVDETKIKGEAGGIAHYVATGPLWKALYIASMQSMTDTLDSVCPKIDAQIGKYASRATGVV